MSDTEVIYSDVKFVKTKGNKNTGKSDLNLDYCLWFIYLCYTLTVYIFFIISSTAFALQGLCPHRMDPNKPMLLGRERRRQKGSPVSKNHG